MIEAEGVRKTYGEKVAVDDLTFTVRPGQVTGFLGPNGAGKSTTMRMIVGLDRPTRGIVKVNGKPFGQHERPLQEVGALLEARSTHPGRSARSHLLAMAAAAGIGAARVDEVLERVGLTGSARQRAGSFSLEMGQRRGLASALLGDLATVILGEPVHGLDLDGIRWIRGLLTELGSAHDRRGWERRGALTDRIAVEGPTAREEERSGEVGGVDDDQPGAVRLAAGDLGGDHPRRSPVRRGDLVVRRGQGEVAGDDRRLLLALQAHVGFEKVGESDAQGLVVVDQGAVLLELDGAGLVEVNEGVDIMRRDGGSEDGVHLVRVAQCHDSGPFEG